MECLTRFILSKSQHQNPQLLTLLHLHRQPLLHPADPPPVVLQHVLHLGVDQGQPHSQISLRPEELGQLVRVLSPQVTGSIRVRHQNNKQSQWPDQSCKKSRLRIWSSLVSATRQWVYLSPSFDSPRRQKTKKYKTNKYKTKK